MNTNRAFITISVAAAMTFIAVLFAVAMSAGWEMMVLLVICAGVLSVVALFFARGLTATGLSIADKRLEGQAEKYRHIEAVLKIGIDPNGYKPMRQLPAPQAAPVVDVRYSDPRRAVALKLLNATLDSEKYGPRSVKVMTQADAAQVGIIADDWSSGVDYLRDFFGVATGNRGTIIKEEGKTVSRVFAEFASVARDVTDSAVGALPEAKR